MSGTKTLLLDVVEIDIGTPDNVLTIYTNIYDNSLSRKWLSALNNLIDNNYHLEKNYCFFGFPDGPRNGEYLIKQINASIDAINSVNLGYQIADHFSLDTVLDSELKLVQSRFNQLHVYLVKFQSCF